MSNGRPPSLAFLTRFGKKKALKKNCKSIVNYQDIALILSRFLIHNGTAVRPKSINRFVPINNSPKRIYCIAYEILKREKLLHSNRNVSIREDERSTDFGRTPESYKRTGKNRSPNSAVCCTTRDLLTAHCNFHLMFTQAPL